MSSLQEAAAATKSLKEKQHKSWEDSTYRKSIMDACISYSPDFRDNPERLELATRFFLPEWEDRSRTFMRRFQMWRKQARPGTLVDLRQYAKFGNGQVLNIATIATNMKVTFAQALMHVCELAAFGLVDRVPPYLGPRHQPVINVRFKPQGYVHLFLALIDLREFNDEECHRLCGFFKPEIDAHFTNAVIDGVVRSFVAKNELHDDDDERDKIVRDAGVTIKNALLGLHPYSADQLSAVTNVPEDIVRWVLLLMALYPEEQPAVRRLSAFPMQKGERFPAVVWSTADASPVEIASMPAPEAKDMLKNAASQSPFNNIGQMPMADAKRILQAVAEQSPVGTDPVIPGPAQPEPVGADVVETISRWLAPLANMVADLTIEVKHLKAEIRSLKKATAPAKQAKPPKPKAVVTPKKPKTPAPKPVVKKKKKKKSDSVKKAKPTKTAAKKKDKRKR